MATTKDFTSSTERTLFRAVTGTGSVGLGTLLAISSIGYTLPMITGAAMIATGAVSVFSVVGARHAERVLAR